MVQHTGLWRKLGQTHGMKGVGRISMGNVGKQALILQAELELLERRGERGSSALQL